MTELEVPRPEPRGRSSMERHSAERVLRRAGCSEEYIAEPLDGITFPAPSSVLAFRGARFGISTESLMD